MISTTLSRPFIIAGPCSAETENQMVQTALALKKTGKVHLLRAGIWKPRTRPHLFEGVGEIGLQWLIKARNLTELPVCTEVAKALHVEKCLEAGVDVLWIGARTTANPFAVQEIAEALKGIDIPVLIKNPINPDLALWIGAIERLSATGITKMGGVHRGFSNAGEKYYRNRPQWQIAIDFKQMLPHLPLYCDPSHMTGKRVLIAPVAQKAMDLHYEGLMIESHENPNAAWSDADQQLTPEDLNTLLENLVLRSENPAHLSEMNELNSLRKKMDHIDEEIIHLIASRIALSKEMGKYKKDQNMTLFQPSRWHQVMENYHRMAKEVQLNPDFLTQLIKLLHDESLSVQSEILHSNKDSSFNNGDTSL
jgi:chorismate mutase